MSKPKFYNLILTLASTSVLVTLFFAHGVPAQAATAPCGDVCSDGAGSPPSTTTPSATSVSNTGPCDPSKYTLTGQQQRSCACDGTPNLSIAQITSCEKCTTSSSCLQNNVIIKRIQTIVNALSAIVGIVIIGSIMFGGIQYSFAGGKPDAVNAARHRIINSIVALAAFLLTFAFLQWLIPGAVFK